MKELQYKIEVIEQVVKIIFQDLRKISAPEDKKAIELQLLEFRLKEYIPVEVYEVLLDLVEEYYQMVQQKKMLELEIVKLRSHVGQLDVEMIRMISKTEQDILAYIHQ